MEPLITVIVPVYMVEKYIDKCVQSIQAQTYNNLEIFLVDDGSKDHCGSICDMYAKKDPRIKVLHKTNGGLSDARNAALDVCSGAYIVFVDSDDFVSEYYIENLLKAALKFHADLAISWFEAVVEGQEQVSNSKPLNLDEVEELDPVECLKRLFYQEGIETTAWGKIYKRKLFEEIRYPVGKLYEDIPVTYQLIKSANSVAVIKNTDYYYLQRNNSIQYQKFDIRKLDAIYHWESVLEDIDINYPQLKTSSRCRYFGSLCNILFQINDDKYEQEKDILWDKLKDCRRLVLKDRKCKRRTTIAALLSYVGYPLMSRIYHLTQMRG